MRHNIYGYCDTEEISFADTELVYELTYVQQELTVRAILELKSHMWSCGHFPLLTDPTPQNTLSYEQSNLRRGNEL